MQINKISQKVFTPRAKTTQNHTNPFGASFKGNIITADVFESAKKVGLREKISEKITQKGRLAFNTVLGSINSLNQKISGRFDSVISFGRRMREGMKNVTEFLNESKLIFNFNSSERFFKMDLANNSYNVKNLVKRDISDLRTEMINLIESRGIING